MGKKVLHQIAVDDRNYNTLKSLGTAGDSFNDVVTRVLHEYLQSKKPMDAAIRERFLVG